MNAAAVRTGELLPPAPAVRARRVTRWLWLPLTPLFLLLSPLGLLLAPFLWVAFPADRRQRNPYVGAIAFGRVLLCLGGLKVDLHTRDARILIRIF